MAKRSIKPKQSVLQGRNKKAFVEGFTGKTGGASGAYAAKRKALKYANTSEEFVGFVGPARGSDPRTTHYAHLYWNAYHVTPDDYSTSGTKAKWYVEIEGLMSYDEWAERYPRGIREYRYIGKKVA